MSTSIKAFVMAVIVFNLVEDFITVYPRKGTGVVLFLTLLIRNGLKKKNAEVPEEWNK